MVEHQETHRNEQGQPREWERVLLEALRAGESLSGAARAAGIHRTTPRHHAKRDPRFAAELAFAQSAPRQRAGAAAVRPQHNTATKIELFLARLAETSNIAAAAEAAELATATIYTLRRNDPDFARRWYAALAEGYDNLEMELLGRLRSGQDAGAAAKGKFDTAAALRVLAAHRESVMREKGRRTLAEEATTIASINAKIDRLRLATEEGEAAIAVAREENAARQSKDGTAAIAIAKGSDDGA